MATIQNTRFYPLHDYSEHDVIPFYSAMDTGVQGIAVKISTGTANPENDFGLSTNQVGATYAGAYSFRPEVKWKTTPTVSGDTKENALGLTLDATLEKDNNDFILKANQRRGIELGAVRSGESHNIVTKGMFGFWGNQVDSSLAAIQPGNVLCVGRSGNGTLAVVDPTNAATFKYLNTGASASWVYEPKHVVGKVLTSLPTALNTGMATPWSSQGGYFLALVNFNK